MGYREVSFKLPTDYREDELRGKIGKELGIREFSWQIDHKSLDARDKGDIHWLLRVMVLSEELKGETPVLLPPMTIPYKKRRERAIVVGSGPAGFFSAFVLQKAGIHTTIIERGSEVAKRALGIREFEKTAVFDPLCNYAFGEGGAGTFSDGKLTSRTKHISGERQFILSSYIQAGAPEEIAYMAHPHLGTDNLRRIVQGLREEFLGMGGTIMFETLLEDLVIRDGKVTGATTRSANLEAEHFVIATGHSAHETYRMLMKNGVRFRTKNFAIGSRVEHPQEIINLAQWGRARLPGVKAADYRLTSKGDGSLPVYTFCMCPGGTVVPAAAYRNTNIVNGMSRYKRDGRFANAACVAGVHPDTLVGRVATPLEALNWLGGLEEYFYRFAAGFQAPSCGIGDFIHKKVPSQCAESSYPFPLKPAALWEMLPTQVSNSIREGLKEFSRKIRGFETGCVMGLESKTSSPVQVIREKNGRCADFENLYMVGEGSGCAGGIISSGADGIKAAMHIIGNSV